MSALRSRRGRGDADSEIMWRDTTMNALLCVLMLLMIVVAKINEEKAKEEAQIQSPGNVIVEISWDSTRNVDLDLWVKGPGDRPVGYSSREGRVFNLLRDDLGSNNDSSELNFENAFSRGIIEGEYVVNVHYFGDHDRQGPITVKVRISTTTSGGGSKAAAEEILFTELEIKLGQEKTAFRFKLDEKGKLVSGSVHHLFMPLRAAGSTPVGG